MKTLPRISQFIKILMLSVCLQYTLQAQTNKRANTATKQLYRNLWKHQGAAPLFGHQDALAYGINPDLSRWILDDNTSDIKKITGQHPAVAGWDLGQIELDSANNLDQVPFASMQRLIVEHYRRGGVNTISWHSHNPVSPIKTTWDHQDSTIRKILNDKVVLARYNGWLDKVARFLKSLKDPSTGQLIPIIFRPYHEHTGNWFWWGAGHCTAREYKQLWRHTVKYLNQKHKLNNLLWVYSTDKFTSKEHYMERYPGNDIIDLMGFDIYHRGAPKSNQTYVGETKNMVAWLTELAKTNKKLTAITETGLDQVSMPTWWTDILSPIISQSSLSYVLVWRNGNKGHFFGPYPGHASADNFKTMVTTGGVLLETETQKLNLYQKH